MKKEYDMKAWSVVLYACALSLIGSLQALSLIGSLQERVFFVAGVRIILWQLVTNIISWVLRWLGRKQVALSYTCLEEESLLHVWCCSDEKRAVWRLGFAFPLLLAICANPVKVFRCLTKLKRSLCSSPLRGTLNFSLWIGEVLALELSSVAARQKETKTLTVQVVEELASLFAISRPI